MKKFILVSIVSFCICSVSFSQINKGSIFLGGSASVYSDKDEAGTDQETKTTNWLITPQIGKAVATNKIVGLFLTFGQSGYKQTSSAPGSAKTESTGSGGGFFYRSYYPLNQRFFLFGNAGLGMSFAREERTNYNGTTNYIYYKNKSTTGSLSLTPGISFAAGKKLHLEASFNSLLYLSYQSSETKEFSSPDVLYRTTDGTTFSAGANANGFSNIAVGLRWILPSKNNN
jgi:hypothetical protein